MNKFSKNVIYVVVILLLCVLSALIGLGFAMIEDDDPLYYLKNGNTEWAVNEACKEVKSRVYQSWGVIPDISGEIVYVSSDTYKECIVIVRYKSEEMLRGYGESVACLVKGYNGEHCHVSSITTAKPYSFDFNLNELKVLWKLD